MANFNSELGKLTGTTLTSVYTAPNITQLNRVDIYTVAGADVIIQIKRSAVDYPVFADTIAAGASVSAIDTPKVLLTGDEVMIESSVGGSDTTYSLDLIEGVGV